MWNSGKFLYPLMHCRLAATLAYCASALFWHKRRLPVPTNSEMHIKHRSIFL